MNMIFYLYRKTFKNRVKRALKKPVTYIYAAFVILYFYFIFRSFPVFFELFEVEGVPSKSKCHLQKHQRGEAWSGMALWR